MRHLLIFTAFMLCTELYAQTQPYTIKIEPVNRSKSLFYCPQFKVEIPHLIDGIGNLYKPVDSVSTKPILRAPWNVDYLTEQSLIKKSNAAKNNVTLIIDTSQYSETKINFYKNVTFNTFSTHYPAQIRTRDINGNFKVESIVKDTIMNFLSQPVFIANLSGSVFYLITNNAQLILTQQARNKKNKWVDIETTFVGDDCGVVRYICELKKNDFVLTKVMRFNGNYKTQLRIKLVANDKVVYSEAYLGNIDYNQIEGSQIKKIKGRLYEQPK